MRKTLATIALAASMLSGLTAANAATMTDAETLPDAQVSAPAAPNVSDEPAPVAPPVETPDPSQVFTDPVTEDGYNAPVDPQTGIKQYKAPTGIPAAPQAAKAGPPAVVPVAPQAQAPTQPVPAAPKATSPQGMSVSQAEQTPVTNAPACDPTSSYIGPCMSGGAQRYAFGNGRFK